MENVRHGRVYFSGILFFISKKMGPTYELFDVKYRYNNSEKMTKSLA